MASTVFQLCKLYFALLISAYLHLQYFFSVYFSLLSCLYILTSAVLKFWILPSLRIHICSTSVLCFLMWFPRLRILTSAVFQFYIIYLPLFVSTYWDLQCSVLYTFILYFSLLPSAYWHHHYFSSVLYFASLVSA